MSERQYSSDVSEKIKAIFQEMQGEPSICRTYNRLIDSIVSLLELGVDSVDTAALQRNLTGIHKPECPNWEGNHRGMAGSSDFGTNLFNLIFGPKK